MLLRLEIGIKYVGRFSMLRVEILRTRHIGLACFVVSYFLLFKITIEINLINVIMTIVITISKLSWFFIFIAGPNCAPQTEKQPCVDR